MQTVALDNTFTDATINRVHSRRAATAGKVLSALAVLFMLLDSTGKLLEVQPVIDGTIRLGYQRSAVFSLGVIELLCVAVYVIPRTSVLGAVLLTGYLGGAVATHVRVENPLFTHTLFPTYLASFLWAGLALRDPALRQFLSWHVRQNRAVKIQTQGAAMKKAVSSDGTAIAYEQTGYGPALILVDGALCSRSFGPMPKLAPLLAPHFTVFTYDRRGRGQSGDTQPYSKEREVEDIAALVQEAGGSAFILGLSSGGALALEAAASVVGVKKVAAYEPPFVEEGSQHRSVDHEHQLKTLLADGKRGGAVKYFMRSMVGAPAPLVVMLRLMPWIWRKLEAVAHTLPYDAAVMNGFKVPTARFASISIPALVMHGSKTDARLQNAATAVANAVPNAQHVTLAEQTHNVKPDVLAPAIMKFFTA